MIVLKVSVKWDDNLRFTAMNEQGHRTEIDATQTEGKPLGITPMELLLMALGACTGIDIVDILHKQRQPLTELEIAVTGERRAEVPHYFEKIHIEYVLTGDGLEERKVQRAIELSQEKYCSVGAMLRGTTVITSSCKVASE